MILNFEAKKKQLDEEGYLVINDVISHDKVIALRAKLNGIYKDLYENDKCLYPDGVGSRERLILNLHNKDEMFLELVDHPSVLPLVRHMLQNGSYQNEEPFILSQFTARDPHMGVPQQQLHIDSRFPGAPYALMTIVLWMLADFTLESGATRLIPKSHLRTYYPKNGQEYLDEIRAVAKAGSVIIYNGSLWHGGGEKLKELERWSIIASYSRWFVKPAFDMTQNTPQDLYDKLTPERRELFGFTTVPPSDEQVRARARISYSQLPDAI